MPRLRSALICAIVLLLSPAVAGQTAAPATGDGQFLALDVFAGTHPQTSTASGPNRPDTTYGWEIGSTLRFRRWLGVTAGVGRVRTPERAWITHVQVGPRVSHALGSLTDLRGFAHVVVGHAASELRLGQTDSSVELMAGGGLDVFNVFRFQVDVVRRDLDAFPSTRGRFLFGVAIPLCFRQCADGDGFAVTR